MSGTGIAHCRDGGQCGGGTGAPGTGYTFSQYDPPVRSASYNGVFYDASAVYRPGKKADGTDLACEGSDATCGAPWTSVYSNGFAGYPGANTSPTIDLTTGYPDSIWCWKPTPTAAEKLTADSNGSVCRRNGRSYSAVTVSGNTTPAIVAGYNYPNASATCSGLEKCKFVNDFTLNGNPYYYTISQVQFCSAKDAAGWGTTPCTSQWDPTTYKYVRYGTGAATFDPQAFTRVDIKPSGFLVNGSAAANPSGRTYAQEMTNFANWYAFYRTRILSMKAATGIAFSALDQNSRVGFHTLWENATLFTNVKDFTAANKQTWLTNAYKVIPNNGTPLPNAMWRVGELFAGNLAGSGLPGATDPLDPVTGKCQPNFHLLSTDGYWNSTLSYASRGNDDKTVPALANLPGATGFTPGASFPRPYLEGATATSDSVADLAMYYWIRDLRPGIADKVKDSVAPWQHVNTYSLSIGAKGTISYPNGINAITSGAASWPPATGAGGPEAIDDLWHAAVNSRGKYFNASNAQQLAESIVSALADFTDQSGTGTAVGIGGAQLSVTNQYAYKTSYEAGIWGDVKKYAIDLDTGVLPSDVDGNPLNAPLWSAATQLDAQAAVSGPVNGWDTQRRIVTINDATLAAVPFRLANLSAAQQASLTSGWSIVASPPTAQSVLNYLRGDKSNEGIDTTSFRTRSHLLGDIVYSAAVPVGAPNGPYADSGAAGSPNPGYNTFKSSARRAPRWCTWEATTGCCMRSSTRRPTAGRKPGRTFRRPCSPAAIRTTRRTRRPPPSRSGRSRSGAAASRCTRTSSTSMRLRACGTSISRTRTRRHLRRRATIGARCWWAGSAPAAAPSMRSMSRHRSRRRRRSCRATPKPPPRGKCCGNSPTRTWATSTMPRRSSRRYAYGWVVLVASGYNNPGGKGFLYVLNPNAPTRPGSC